MRNTIALIGLAILASAASPAQAAPPAANILAGTPWWAYAILALLIYTGLQATKPRSVSVQRLLVVPLVFSAWGIVSLLLMPVFSPGPAITWFATAGLGAVWAVKSWGRSRIKLDRASGRVDLPASWVPLMRNLAIFAAKYAVAVRAAINLEARGYLAPWDMAISGLSAGYFLGWLARFAALYFTAPDAQSRKDASDVTL